METADVPDEADERGESAKADGDPEARTCAEMSRSGKKASWETPLFHGP